jgi:hypothetical protein
MRVFLFENMDRNSLVVWQYVTIDQSKKEV